MAREFHSPGPRAGSGHQLSLVEICLRVLSVNSSIVLELPGQALQMSAPVQELLPGRFLALRLASNESLRTRDRQAGWQIVNVLQSKGIEPCISVGQVHALACGSPLSPLALPNYGGCKVH